MIEAMLYYAVILAGACQLTDWIFRLVELIEEVPESSRAGGGVRFGHRRKGGGNHGATES